jgi:Rieske Fe-S protein
MGITIVGSVPMLLAGCEASQVLTPGTASSNTITVDVTSLDADGKALVTGQRGPDGKHILVVRRGASEYLALSMECSHQQCEVEAPTGGVIHCPCHGSQYDLTGAVLQGPAPLSLRRYPLSLDAGGHILTIVLS